jgi:tRNA(Ile)-lysidine synthase
MELVRRVAAFCRREGLFARGQRVAVAVSGGRDSVVLLDVLVQLQALLGIRLCVATVDHRLRADSAQDAAFVRGLAADHGLPCYCGRVSVSEGRGLEAEARRQRFAFLSGVPADRVALGHHRDDQAETVLLRVLRGTGLDGLDAIAPSRPPFVRPLLAEPGSELLTYARHGGLRWREDPSNHREDLERNVLRRDIMPGLEAVHGGSGRRLAGLADNLRADARLLDDLAAEAWERLHRQGCLDRFGFGRCPRAIQLRLLLRLLREDDSSVTEPTSEGLFDLADMAVAGEPGSHLDVPGGWRFAIDRSQLRCLPPVPAPIRPSLPGRWPFGPYRIAVHELDAAARVEIRTPLPGDRSQGRRLANVLPALGVPASLRPYHPVVLLGGEIAWVPPGEPMRTLKARLKLSIAGPGLVGCTGQEACIAL